MDRTGLKGLAVAALLAPGLAAAQDSTLVTGYVVSAATGVPVPYATYAVSPGGVRRFTNAQGGFSFRASGGRPYKISIRQIGYTPFDTTILAGKPALQLRLRVHPAAYRLGTVRTFARRTCEAGGGDAALGGILDEVRKNAEREIVLRQSYPFQYTMERARRFEGWSDVFKRDTAFFHSGNLDPYRVGAVVRDRLDAGGEQREMRIPQLTDLADENFLAHHCFSYGGVRRINGHAAYVVAFEPARDVTTPDVRGTILLDTATLRVRQASLALTRGEQLHPPPGTLEVTTTYHDLFPGVALFDEITAVETFDRERPTDALQKHIERQRLLGVTFLAGSPRDVDSSATVAYARRPAEEGKVEPIRPPRPYDSAAARAAIAAQMESDLRSAGFYDRKLRFPHASFLDLAEIEKRIQSDSTSLVPEIPWVRLGATPAGNGGPPMGLTASAERCTINLYVNGQASHVPSTGSVPGRNPGRSRLTFPSSLGVSRIGAIELYPAGSASPSSYPRDDPRCGLVLMWTRPEIQ